MTGELPLIGFGLPMSGSGATAAVMIATARRAEELGYASLWTFQRILVPAADPTGDASYELANPAARPLDDPSYQAVQDPLLPLALVAGHTTRIRLGTATVCAPFIPPAVLAKATATLDRLSGGRLDVGLGIGWLPQEYVAAGVPYARRGARMEEYLRCLDLLWTQDPAEFDGEFYTVPRSHLGVAPVQQPHPPLLLGGAAPAALRRAGRLAQGWISSTRQDPRRLGDAVRVVRDGAREAGRDPDALRIVVRAVVDLTEQDPGAQRLPFQGTRQQVLDDFVGLREQGATEVFVDLNFSPSVGSPDVDAEAAGVEVERVLDAFAPARL